MKDLHVKLINKERKKEIKKKRKKEILEILLIKPIVIFVY